MRPIDCRLGGLLWPLASPPSCCPVSPGPGQAIGSVCSPLPTLARHRLARGGRLTRRCPSWAVLAPQPRGPSRTPSNPSDPLRVPLLPGKKRVLSPAALSSSGSQTPGLTSQEAEGARTPDAFEKRGPVSEALQGWGPGAPGFKDISLPQVTLMGVSLGDSHPPTSRPDGAWAPSDPSHSCPRQVLPPRGPQG